MQYTYKIVDSSSSLHRGEEGFVFKTTSGKVGFYKRALSGAKEFATTVDLLEAIKNTEGLLDDITILGNDIFVTREDVLEEDTSKRLTRHIRITTI